jgi:hypothetical protein
MKNMKGSALIVGLLVLGFFAIIGISYLVLSFKWHDFAVSSESNIEKFNNASKTTLSTYTLIMQDKMQVQDVHVESFTKAVEAQMSGRYGDEGVKGMMLWITENNLQFDQSVIKEMAAYVRAGRTEIKLSQDRKQEHCTDYEVAREKRWSGWWIEHEGFPVKDIEKLCRMVLDADTTNSFETGIVERVDLKR